MIAGGSGRARAVPLVALVSVVAALVIARARERYVAKVSGRGAALTHLASAIDGAPPGAALAHAPAPRAAEDPDAAVESPVAPRGLHEDARHTHRARGVNGPVKASVAWTAHVGGAVQAQVVASPDEKTLYVASLDGALTALAASDGAKRWSVALGDRAYGTPCVASDGTIYVGSDAKRFFAITPAGVVVWKLEVGGEADTAATLTPAGLVVFAAGTDVYAVRGGGGASGGDVAWRFAAKKKVFTAPAVAEDGSVVFGSQDHHVYGLGPGGSLAWSTDLGADVDGGPVIADDGDVLVGTDAGDVVRLRGTNGNSGKAGEVAWRAPLGGFVRGALSLARDGDVLAGVYGPAPRLVRLAPDGAVRASFPVPGTGAREMGVHGGPLEDARGALFFGAQDDLVRAIFPALPPSAPAVAHGWSYEMSADVDAPLTLLSSGALVAASDDGNVVLFAP